jgi:hypothetical protein
MDFRMDKLSYGLLGLMFLIFVYSIMGGWARDLSIMGYLQVILFGLLVTIAFVALASIPVLIYCYIVKKIPDIDYSINVAFGMTLLAFIFEKLF